MIAEDSFVPRRAAAHLDVLMDHARIVAITGPRQSGKSTLARYVTQARASTAPGATPSYVSLDEQAPRNAALEDPDGFVASLRRPAVIDEVQRVPDLMLALKAVVDRDPTPGQFVVTGSADLATIRTIADALPGRIDYVDLWPFMQCEIEGTPGRFVDRAFASDIPMIQNAPVGAAAYAQRIVGGGFPEAVARPDAVRGSYFGGYARSIFEHDVPTVSNRNPAAARRVLEACAASTATLLNASQIGRMAGVDTKTALGHLDVLEQLFLICRIPAWSPNQTKRQVRSPKLHMSDSGLACHVANLDASTISPLHGSTGGIVETFAATEIIRLASVADVRTRAYHYRDRDGHEVDVVLEGPGGRIVGVEIKSGATVSPSSFSGLRHLRSLVGERFVGGIVLYTGAGTLPFGEGMWAVPLTALWEA